VAFVTETARRLSSATTLIAGLTFVAQLAGRLIGEGGARGRQRKQAGEQE
jgi:hypothetical protein